MWRKARAVSKGRGYGRATSTFWSPLFCSRALDLSQPFLQACNEANTAAYKILPYFSRGTEAKKFKFGILSLCSFAVSLPLLTTACSHWFLHTPMFTLCSSYGAREVSLVHTFSSQPYLFGLAVAIMTFVSTSHRTRQRGVLRRLWCG